MSAVLCAPQWTATCSCPRQARKSSATRLRSSTSKSTPFARRPEGEQTVDAVRCEKPDVGLEGVFVDLEAAAHERRQRSGDGSVQHRPTVSRRP